MRNLYLYLISHFSIVTAPISIIIMLQGNVISGKRQGFVGSAKSKSYLIGQANVHQDIINLD